MCYQVDLLKSREFGFAHHEWWLKVSLMDLSPVVDKIVDNGPDPLWEGLKDQLKSKISPLNYNNWFKPISTAKKRGEHFVISVPNKFIADWISDYYLELLEKEVSGLAHELLKIRFEIEEDEVAINGNGN